MPKRTMNLDAMDAEEIAASSINVLRALCKAERLKAGGGKKDLAARLVAKKHGITDKYVGPPLTRCKVCKEQVTVRRTIREPMEDGRVRVTRHVRCRGRHGHSYKLVEVVGEKKEAR